MGESDDLNKGQALIDHTVEHIDEAHDCGLVRKL